MATLSRRRFLADVGLAALSGMLVSCGAGAVPEARSSKPRQSSPQISPDDVRVFAAGHNAFGLAFYRLLGAEFGNLFFSPYSIAQALTMVSAGARGTTAQQIAQALHSALPQERLHPVANALDLALSSRSAWWGGGFQLEIANSIWGQRNYTFRPEFLDLLAENYGAGLRLLDFASAPDDARKTINATIAEQTHDKIKDLLPPGSIGDGTALFLTNAIYFNANWREPFPYHGTSEQPFYLDNNSTVSVPLMILATKLRYAETSDCQAVTLPYERDVSMLVLLPRAGGLADFEQRFSIEGLHAIRSELVERDLILRLPKLTYQSRSVSLQQALTQLGMADAFKPGTADFSGMDGTRNLYLNEVYHQAMVRVDEKGTEAAAATGAGATTVSAPIGMEMTVDRPFIFAIQDDATGALLFLGRVANPQTAV